MTPTIADSLALVERHGVLPPGALSASIVGSAARGWHNERSDIDVYVIVPRPWTSDACRTVRFPLDPPEVRTVGFKDDGRRWQVTYYLDTQVEQMLAKVSWAEFGNDRTPGLVLARREEMFLSRLATCLTLVGDQYIKERREQLAASAFRSFMVARSLAEVDDCVEDALGQMAHGDLECAVLAARKALGHIVDALLEERGEYASELVKWRPLRFRAANPPALSFEDYWALETMRGYDPDDPAGWINEVLTLCQNLSLEVEI